VVVDPRLDLGGVEPDELADFHIRDPPLGDQTPNEPVRRPEPGRYLGDVEQPDFGRRWVRSCRRAWTCWNSHIHQRRVEQRKRVSKISDLTKIRVVHSPGSTAPERVDMSGTDLLLALRGSSGSIRAVDSWGRVDNPAVPNHHCSKGDEGR